MTRDRAAQASSVAHTAYWTLGQTVYLQLTFGTQDPGLAIHFDDLFQTTISSVFADGMNEQEVRVALADARGKAGNESQPL